MVGNCQEWTADLFLDQAYALTPAEVVDPLGPSPEQCPMPQRAVRGGLCGAPMTAIMNRVAFRVGAFEQYQGPTIGLRLVVEADG
jgi:formylglycine-generating enzyme required for sulfatase activity